MSRLNLNQLLQTAVQHHQAGELAQAQALYQQILARQPNHIDALHLSGLIAHQLGQNETAVELISNAIALKPNFPQALCNLGNTLRDMGRLDAALAACRRAISLKPDLPEAHCNLGNALQDKGQTKEAVAAYRQAIALRPDYPEALSNLGAALRDREHLDEAIAASRRAIAIRPGYGEAYSNLGIALHENMQLDDAIVAYRKAIALNPNLPESHYNLGTALRDKGLLDDGTASLRRAIELRPHYAEAHNVLGIVLLLRGEFAPGWKEYEWRSLCSDFPPALDFGRPQWNGSDLAGRTIVVHAEQGFGDTIQFIRYLPLIAKRGGRVIFRCDVALRRLLAGAPGIDHWLAMDEPLPAFHEHCPLMSIPFALRTTLETIPGDVAYLQAASGEIERWRQDLASFHHPVTPSPHRPLKIGLAWAGRPTHRNDRNRSMALSAFALLARHGNAMFFSLQKGDAAAQSKSPPAGMKLIDRTHELSDFSNTAALIANLDLVISVDTAVAHLAGAMGKPVWLLLPFMPDWRWLLDRDDSPWYPSMRLFRQPRIGDWASVVERVAEELTRFMLVEDAIAP